MPEQNRNSIIVKFLSLILYILSPFRGFSQFVKDLTLKNQRFIKGNPHFIGNNRAGKLNTKLFNGFSAINDLIEARNIKVDDDESTFSSSSETPEIEGPKSDKESTSLYLALDYIK